MNWSKTDEVIDWLEAVISSYTNTMSELTNDAVDGALPEAALVELSEIDGEKGCQSDCQLSKGEEEAGEVAPEAKEKRHLESEEERDRDLRIRKPWLYETQTPMTDPPDINHRGRIIYDQKAIDRLFEDEDLHFTERCSRYQRQDVNVETDILWEYMDWTEYMLKDAEKRGNETREKFFEELYEVVEENWNEVFDEGVELSGREIELERRILAQKLGIPSNHEEWTTEDKRRYVNSPRWITGWPFLSEIRRLLKVMDQTEPAVVSQGAGKEQSKRDGFPFTSGDDDNHQSPQPDGVDEEALPSPTNTPESRRNEEIKDNSADTSAKSEVETHSTESQSCSPLNAKLQLQRGATYYRTFTLLLLMLLLHDLVKQKFRL